MQLYHYLPDLSSFKLVILLSVLSLAVDVSHERHCPVFCRCGASKSLSKYLVTIGSNADLLTVNCTGKNLKEVPLLPDEDSKADALLLPDNKISHLDLAFLKHYPNLKAIVVRKNGLKSLSKSGDDYQPFFSLVHVDLSDNQLHVLHPYVFAGFPALKTLNMSGNVLHTISSNAFTLPALQTLDLSRNQLGVLQESLFDTSPKLRDITLSRNGISRLNDGTFGLLTHLDLLDLSHNSLMKLEDNVFVGMNITHLDLGFNSLRKVPGGSLRKLTAAKTIVLDGNMFYTLEDGALNRISVEFLSISHCPHLVRVSKGAISSMADLEALTLNDNRRLNYFHPAAITDAPRLAALDLSGNSMFALEEGLSYNLPQMRALYLGGNNFHCHCSLKWLGSPRLGLIPNPDEVKCRPDGHLEPISLSEMSQKFQEECEPYILPLFDLEEDVMMGKNISWLCKALGSVDIELAWRLPQQGTLVRGGHCSDRVCLDGNANVLTIRYLHPSDGGRYTCMAKNKFGQDQRQIRLNVKSEHIQIFPIAVASTFVTLSWNTSASLSTGRGYILRVRFAQNPNPTPEDNEMSAQTSNLESGNGAEVLNAVLKQYDDIDVGLKMNSYTVNGLRPGLTYLFELCLRKDIYVITISSATLTTKYSGFEVALGIETDYVTLFAVAIILTSIVITCITISVVRWWRYRLHISRMRTKDGQRHSDTSSQREMILSPSDHSSVNCPSSSYCVGQNGATGVTASSTNQAISISTSSSMHDCVDATCDKSRLMEHEVISPTEEFSETIA